MAEKGTNPLYQNADPEPNVGQPTPGNNTSGTAQKPMGARATLHAKLGGPAAGIDMVTLIAKQNRFLAYAFGATSHYHGKDIVMGHAHLIINRGLNLTHFDKVAGHFVDSLKEMGVPQDLIDQAAGVLMGVRPLFDPERYKGKIDVEKIEKTAAAPQAKAPAGGRQNDPPACCSIM
ncbi:hypothetical protein GPECTOR_54g209 [Gonium pectorale]|uniref:Uncharacterized protein n=1 Tax=Gonium pectorale TaxID=33097 RepID=A0A150G6K7_GONPE|nr:hypothetical protein GPECTOR_54g209 [Gonium pectorale]|eukprot:KXZ45468.1 hypothetical protein GPECTOR_54g209 [Gonium pectorale]